MITHLSRQWEANQENSSVIQQPFSVPVRGCVWCHQRGKKACFKLVNVFALIRNIWHLNVKYLIYAIIIFCRYNFHRSP